MHNDIFFDPQKYLQKINAAKDYIQKQLPQGFTPRVAMTLGSGGLGEIATAFDLIRDPIPYTDIPGFDATSVVGHTGQLIAGYIENVPVLGYQGRKHFYEEGAQPNEVIALKKVVFPVYVARALGANLYFATNAAGGLKEGQKPGDLMIIDSHLDLYFPNPLQGPQVDFMNPLRFQPQDNQYESKYRTMLQQAAKNAGEEKHIHNGVYCALTGPTYESRADCQALRALGVDAVGMSTVPEIIVAANIGMETVGFSLITNIITANGTNATSHEEVTAALLNPQTKQRILTITKEFYKLLS